MPDEVDIITWVMLIVCWNVYGTWSMGNWTELTYTSMFLTLVCIMSYLFYIFFKFPDMLFVVFKPWKCRTFIGMFTVIMMDTVPPCRFITTVISANMWPEEATHCLWKKTCLSNSICKGGNRYAVMVWAVRRPRMKFN